MKVCLLSARFRPQRCGVGDYTYFLAAALAKIGHDVDVLTTEGKLDDVLYPLPPKVRLHRVINSWGARGLSDLVTYLRRLDPHVLLIQYTPHSFDQRGITFAINLLPVIVRGVDTVCVITNFHELYIPLTGSLTRRLGALWQRTAAVLIACGSHALSVSADEWQRRLRRLGVRKRIELIPAGSNIPLVTISDEHRDRARTQLLGTSSGVLVAAFGAYHDRDIPAALHALYHLKRERPAKLVWIGGGSLAERDWARMRQAIRVNGLREDDVEWVGELPHPDVSRLLSACDLMMLPFIDGVSTRRTSAATALQHSLPLLTTQGEWLEPWFLHGENVYLAPVADRQALADGLLQLARSSELRSRLARGARALYDAHFAWDVIALQVSCLAQDALRS